MTSHNLRFDISANLAHISIYKCKPFSNPIGGILPGESVLKTLAVKRPGLLLLP
jgi:hypothetical protein